MEYLKKVSKFAIPAAMMTPFLALAAVNYPAGSELTLNKVQTLIETIANWLIVVGVVIAAIFIIWGGLRYMLARGDKTKADEAKKSILHGIIGAAVVLGVGVILNTTAALVTRSFFGAGQ